MHFARGVFDLEKGPCNLQEGFSTPENVPAICERVFQPRKTPLQFAWTFSAAGPTPGAENGKISVETGKDIAA